MNKLKTKEKINLIEHLVRIRLDARSKINDIDSILNTYSFPLASTFYELFDSHVKLVEEILDDKDSWITWFIDENNCGEFKRKVTIKGKTFSVNTVKKLVTRVMEAQ